MQRTGAKSIKLIPKEVLEGLNLGTIETVNLVEWLAVDQKLLLKNFLFTNNLEPHYGEFETKINNLSKLSVNTINKSIGESMYDIFTSQKRLNITKLLIESLSDMVRCWGCYCIAKNTTLNLEDFLEQIKIMASDNHFGVREIAWMAARPRIEIELDNALIILSKWANSPDPNIRRFVTESTRPRGVWCQHIEELKQKPEKMQHILEMLYNDNSKYVQNSLANWLNDASKTKPEFVIGLCKIWSTKSDSKATQYIIKRALSTISKE